MDDPEDSGAGAPAISDATRATEHTTERATDPSRARIRIEALEARIRELEAEGERARTSGARQLILESALAQSSDGIAVADLEGNLRFVNRAWAEMHGYRADEIPELIEQHLRVFHTPDQARDELRPIAQHVLAEGSYQGEIGHLRKDGSTFRAREAVTILENAFGEAGAVMAIAHDITEEKQAAEALRASEARFRALAENAFDLIVDIDSAGALTYVNPRVEDLLGYPRELGIGRPYHELIHRNDVDSRPAGSPRTGSTLRRVRHADGSWRIIEFSGRAYRTADDDLHYVAIGRDVTEQKSLEEERRQHAQDLEREVDLRTRELALANTKLQALQTRLLEAERLGTTEDLAGSVAHAINNPLAALIGTAQMAGEPGAAGAPPIERILHLALRIKSVVDQTLQLFRRGQLDLSFETAQSILDDVRLEIEGRASAQAVALEIAVDPDVPKIQLDTTLVRAAIVGLAENALDAMPRGGHLRIRAQTLPGVDYVSFRVSDTGPGIPPELREKIFEPFFTTKRAGTGLGLAIANGVIRGHRGRIHIEDARGGGATVAIELPLRGPAETAVT